MILKASEVDDVRQMGERGAEGIRSLRIDGMTLGAALELACCWLKWDQEHNDAGTVIAAWAQSVPYLKGARVALQHRGFQEVPLSDRYGAPEWEVCSAPLESQLDGIGWLLFQERFMRSLQRCGFSGNSALALSKALREMADNIPRHCSPSPDRPCPGVVGYRVQDGRMSFAVADVGRGVLASLRQNPRWASLTTSADALEQAAWGATSNPHEEQGDGFSQVHRALGDLNGFVRFRSGDGAFTINRLGETRGTWRSFRVPMAGFQLCVSCFLHGIPNLDEL